MGEYRDFLKYVLISIMALGAVLVFMKLLVTYLGEVAVVLYRYEAYLIPGMLLFVGILTASVLHLEPGERLLYPFRWIRNRIEKMANERNG